MAFLSFISSCFTGSDGFGTALVWSDWSAIVGPPTAASVTSGLSWIRLVEVFPGGFSRRLLTNASFVWRSFRVRLPQ